MPTKEDAISFAIMLNAGLPGRDAIRYFIADATEVNLAEWMASKDVAQATLKLQGKSFQDMTLSEKIEMSLNLHYSQMAYYLYSHNYSDLSGNEKLKADTCRQALEVKTAGMAGKLDALSQFYADMLAQKKGMPLLSKTAS